MKYFEYRNIKIRYEVQGSMDNPAVVLLHGYLESLEIWENFVPLLAGEYFVISLDLPGHGKSGILNSVHRMDDLAEVTQFVMDKLGVKKAHIVGHSMGGYVALAFRETFHHNILSCVLFHSSCYPDTPEKRENRNREINLLKEGRKELIVNTNIPKAFADDNLEKLSPEIERAKRIALSSDEKGIIALLNGMKERPNRCVLLKDDKVPVLLIAGKKDNYIPFEIAERIPGLGNNVELAILENSGHMGFIEEKERAAEVLHGFFQKHK
jgi:pimeloyl-ACP methyl ester carboxylesterase